MFPAIGALASTVAGWSLTAGFAASIVAGIFRVITLLGVGVAVYEGLDVLGPKVLGLFDQAEALGGGLSSGGINPLAEVFALLKVKEALSLVISAFINRFTFRLGLVLTKTATGGG